MQIGYFPTQTNLSVFTADFSTIQARFCCWFEWLEAQKCQKVFHHCGRLLGTQYLGKETKNTSEHVIMKKKIFIYARASGNKAFVHSGSIDPLTDTAAILNLLHLTSTMGCPGGTRSVFRRAFRAKRELHCIILGKKAMIITSKHGTTIFFLIIIFFQENVKKN